MKKFNTLALIVTIAAVAAVVMTIVSGCPPMEGEDIHDAGRAQLEMSAPLMRDSNGNWFWIRGGAKGAHPVCPTTEVSVLRIAKDGHCFVQTFPADIVEISAEKGKPMMYLWVAPIKTIYAGNPNKWTLWRVQLVGPLAEQ